MVWCVCSSWIDVVSRRLPNVLTGLGATAIVAHAVYAGDVAVVLAGGAMLFTCYLLVHLLLPAAFGAGDVKLSFTLGGAVATAGVDAWVSAALLAPLLTGLVGIVFAARGRGDAAIPHGPSMCSATLLALAAFPT